MTEKFQKIREEVARLKSNLIHGACASQIAMETRCKEEAYNEVLAILDTMQEEPVVEDLEKIAAAEWDNYVRIIDGEPDNSRMLIERNGYIELAKHFFELGMSVNNKEQKGEKVC